MPITPGFINKDESLDIRQSSHLNARSVL